MAIELTSLLSRHADTRRKFELYRDVLQIKEYFLFDPFDDYLVPRFQGYRLRGGEYVPIKMVSGQMHSQVLDRDLAPVLDELRLYAPWTTTLIPTPLERLPQSETACLRAEAALDRAKGELKKMRSRLSKLGLNGETGNAS